MARIAVCVSVLVVVLAGCNKPAVQVSPEVTVPEKSVADLAPESAAPSPPPLTSAAERPTHMTALTPPSSREPARATTPAPAGKSYTVQQGDTLWTIARKLYGDPKRSKDIAQANNIVDPSKLRIGQVLAIP